MNEEIDESEFFHQDFTTASEWEIFIARLEEIINQWKNDDTKNENPTTSQQQWNIRTEPLTFTDFDFNFTYYKKHSNECTIKSEESEESTKKNPFDSYYDFSLYDPTYDTNDSCLANWYGIDEYMVLSPAGNVGITTESRIKILLSSVYVVSSNTSCEIPIFVQIREKWQHCYLGVYESEEVRTNLEMVHLKITPRHCHYVSGLVELFKSKIMSPVTMLDVIVSVQTSYTLSEFGNVTWKQDYITTDNDSFDFPNVCSLPFGVTVEPVHSFIFKTTSSHLSHRSVTDCESFTYFEPLNSMKWSLLIETTDQPICLLGECLNEFLCSLNNSMAIQDILGDFAITTPEINNPLDLLTESKVPTISTLLSRAARNSLTKSRRGNAPLSEDILVPILYFLFPDADEESKHPYKDFEPKNYLVADDQVFDLEHQCRGIKTSNCDSLVWRLATVLAHALQSLGGLKAFAHIWFEFVQEMRYRWEKSISISGLLPGSPDLRTCLLQQKLQMLNCCIDRQKARDNSSILNFDSAEEEENSSTDDDDEFFDCTEKVDDETKRNKEKYSLWNQPTGRLGKFQDLKLIETGDSLYIPLTQEPVPKSEDQLEEDTDVLMKLGSDAQGSELRAKMMSASLLSDMESFKAANPGSILEDFIRWYSPRDWLEDEELDQWGQKKGHLSSRMLIEDNFWIQTWQSAKPVPANRQKRLFDDTREAEKVLHYLDSRTIAQICELLIPVLSHAAIYKLYEESQQLSIEVPDAVDRLRTLIKHVERISRENKLQTRRFESFIQEVTALELNISQVNSLLYKFNPSGSIDEKLSYFVRGLVSGKEIEIENRNESNIGTRLMIMFSEAQKVTNLILSGGEQSGEDGKTLMGNAIFPQANEREIVLRVSAPRPASYSTECPHFLRAILAKNEFRLVGAFSEDIMFF